MYDKYKELLNFKEFTPIQIETFKNFKNKRNLIGMAPTGTGKTHAYLIPIVDSINIDEPYLQAIIVLPTNELINQVYEMIKPLISQNLKVKAYDSTINKQRELNWLENNQPHIVISTPEKVSDFSRNGLNIGKTKYFVLDEADMMFDDYFLSKVDDVIARIPDSKYLLFSATITNNMHQFIKKYFGVYDLIDTNKEHKLDIEHRLIKINFETRESTLEKIVKKLNPYLAIIFISKKEDQLKVYNLLKELNQNVTLISSDLSKHQRKNILSEIHELKYQYVVASDLASRGIDFDASHIINFDLPKNIEFFRHRSGRTGRMGKSGIVITIVDNDDRNKVAKLIDSGINFIDYDTNLEPKRKKEFNQMSKSDLESIKKIPKPKKVKPNYKKKNKEQIKKLLKGKKNAKNR